MKNITLYKKGGKGIPNNYVTLKWELKSVQRKHTKIRPDTAMGIS